MAHADSINALGGFGPKAVPLLAEDLASDDFYIVQRAAEQLGDIGGKEAAEVLLAAVRYTPNDLRVIFINNLAGLKYAPAFDALCGFLEHGTDKERVASAMALGKMGDPRAIGPLRKAGAEGDELLKGVADEAISSIEAVSQAKNL